MPERAKPRVRFADYLPERVRCVVRDDPPELVINRARWHGMTLAEQRALVAHELGHLATATLHSPYQDQAQSTVIRHEALADRHALRQLIPDARVVDATCEGCQTAGEYAEAWGVDEPTARARLRLFYPAAFGVLRG